MINKPKKAFVDYAYDALEMFGWLCAWFFTWYVVDLSIDLVKLNYFS